MKDRCQVTLAGRVMIRDALTNELIVDKSNAIHPQNMAFVIAKALSRDSNGYIYEMDFGNGGTFYNSSNQIVYRPPNTVGAAATLYNTTYSVQVDEQSVGTPSTNSVVSAPSASPAITSIITITAQLNANEPTGQAAADNVTTDPGALYMFDEVGLRTPAGVLSSHLVFSPFEKTAI